MGGEIWGWSKGSIFGRYRLVLGGRARVAEGRDWQRRRSVQEGRDKENDQPD